MFNVTSTSKGKRKSVKSSASTKKGASSALASAQSASRSRAISNRRMNPNPIQKGITKGTEKKYCDWGFIAAANNSTIVPTVEANDAGLVRFVGGAISVGTGAALNRIGRSIILKSFQFNGYIKANSAATAQYVRWMLLLDDDPGASLPAVSDILDQTLSGSAATGKPEIDFRQLETTDRFTVLKSGTLTISGAGNEDAIQDLSFFYKPPQDIEIRYKTSGAGVYYNGVEKGALLFLVIGSNPTGTTASTITGAYRMRYVDN